MERHEKIVYELAEWIKSNIHSPLKIEDVATRSGYSKWHLQRMFHRIMNISLGHYIRDRKLESAAKDLLVSQETVIDISVKYGYDSQQSFTRSFVRKYNLPPARFRRVNTQNFTTSM
ncbi:helix-turn-helix domain-containing protein [Pantoea sp. Cy-640]|uniref:helix-turn-helix domain-containing protein n=1 Tax=Pantoea sp. Cy-640 TaxID=2608353 RepID=UPI00141A1A99|nr:helix-turn-helix domain-containing protein [Pantoea sp. Cy-640]NIG16171.1 helix-turn-helix domain-containing protein [Pantoea sp. Cy-640]